MKAWEGRIEVNPQVMLGKPVIRGTRVTVEHILRKLAANMTVQEVLQDCPSLTEEDVLAALAYASDAIGSEDILPAVVAR